jgi:hypothetical protein
MMRLLALVVRDARAVIVTTALSCWFVFVGSAIAEDRTWPRELDTEMGVFTFYQPQPDKFENNLLQGRAAISLVAKGKKEPVFGVIWFSGRVDTDRDEETALLRDIVVTNARWPERRRGRAEAYRVSHQAHARDRDSHLARATQGEPRHRRDGAEEHRGPQARSTENRRRGGGLRIAALRRRAAHDPGQETDFEYA